MSLSTNGRATSAPASHACGVHVPWPETAPRAPHIAECNITMGNAGSAGSFTPSNKILEASLEDARKLRHLVVELRAELNDRDARVDELQSLVEDLQLQVDFRDAEETRLKQEIHKLKSVLQATTPTRMGNKTDLLASLHEHHSMAGQTSAVKRQGVSGESFNPGKMNSADLEKHDKDFRSKQLIKDAISANDFLKNLDALQVKEMVDCMYLKHFPQGSLVIQEGEPGSHLYVSADGELMVKKDGSVLGKMGSGKAFGELAILYNCTRTASVEALTESNVWCLDRRVFQMIVMKTGIERQEEYITHLRRYIVNRKVCEAFPHTCITGYCRMSCDLDETSKYVARYIRAKKENTQICGIEKFTFSVPLLQDLRSETLAKIADVVEVEFYPSGDYIVRQGMTGDTFFIISNGSVKITQRFATEDDEEEIRILQKGDYFGEQALLREDCRTANVIALPPGVECLTLDRESFKELIGDVRELRDKDYGDQIRNLQRPPSSVGSLLEMEGDIAEIQFSELEIVATLGVGGFGRVELVQFVTDCNRTFALKCLTKQHILETRQQEHLYSEKNIMMACRSPFIARLYKTFKDRKYVYMLMEACLGGEVWTILRDRGHFDDPTTRFYTACVVEALEYLHARGIIYRDLKPENLLLNSCGYAKLVDFGFSKRLRSGQKTWTFCGTPEYVAPEIILNKGHDRAVDYWSLGVLMFELFVGVPPFSAADPMKTYNIILKGIDMIDFPRHVNRHAQSLIKRLCRDSPSERLGYQKNGISDIKKHKWFQGFDWDGLKSRTMPAPILPQVSSAVDTSNFDCYPRQTASAPDEMSGWDADF
uniref:cGMP-dependent protein kinase n=1 Tax=Strigamia maritima TaxID=126957 RepID=T1IS67_STRMM